jgi:putative ABC transport system permease protein
MLTNYFKTGWRNLVKNKGYSIINIGGLSAGLAVTMLIALWIWDELSFNKDFHHYSRLGQVWQFVTFDVEKASYSSLPIPLSQELRDKYPDFELVSLSSNTRETTLTMADKKLMRAGNFVEPDFPEMLSLKMIAGGRNGLRDMNNIIISQRLAEDLFGAESALGKTIELNESANVSVSGVFEDFPDNSSFKDTKFLASWTLYTNYFDAHAKKAIDVWDENSWQIFVQLRPGADFEGASHKIRDIRMKRDNPPGYRPEFFVHPMSKWHLYSDFKNGVNTGGLITFVWLFGIIGLFVLALACINFMNLATARSEKRAREVGVRKSMGSPRIQLIFQFVCESLLTVLFGFALSLVLVKLLMPSFNALAAKNILIPWNNPQFWILGITCSLITGLLSASYPALYLSSFVPVKVLKGTFRPGRWAAVPRKVLVVLQFSISITLMIGITIVFLQIDFARNRPVGYEQRGLIEVRMKPSLLQSNYDVLRHDLITSGVVEDVAGSLGSITLDFGGTTAVSWPGKNPDSQPLFMLNKITPEFGKTVAWTIAEGRDFSSENIADKNAIIINESAAKFIGFKNPTQENLKLSGKDYRIIGVVKDVIKESPFRPVQPSLFMLDKTVITLMNIKLRDDVSTDDALEKIQAAFKKHNPEGSFDYSFVDELYAAKYSHELRIGKLSGFFTALAVLISCLGIFGLASFVAEQRTKEMGIRKIMGASVFGLWKMLSKDFVVLVAIASVISIPLASYVMSRWLENYEYRITLSWWIFGFAALVAFVITLITVSFQSVKAASINPVKSLRSE